MICLIPRHLFSRHAATICFLFLSCFLLLTESSSGSSSTSSSAFVTATTINTKTWFLHQQLHPKNQLRRHHDSRYRRRRCQSEDSDYSKSHRPANSKCFVVVVSSSSSSSASEVESSSISSSSWRRSIHNASYTLSRKQEETFLHDKRRPWWWRLRQWMSKATNIPQRRIQQPSTSSNETSTTLVSLDFEYEYEQLYLGDWNNNTNTDATAATGILLIHPIGVGIGKWYYHRLLQALWQQQEEGDDEQATTSRTSRRPVLVVVPDLLGSSSACPPTITIISSSSSSSSSATGQVDNNNNNKSIVPWTRPLPLLNISDWTNQMVQLLNHIQQNIHQQHPTNMIQNWCIVANGGCAPIALQVAAIAAAQQQQQQQTAAEAVQLDLTNIILSSVPQRLSFFLESSTDPSKVQRAYRTLCGIPGKLFWWYATCNNGQFIQTFSERNLVANASSLGDAWRPNCHRDATRANGASRYSTFAFLAGALQDGCQTSLTTILDDNSNNNTIQIDFINGRDVRRNSAKSWFWQKRKQQQTSSSSNETTIMDYVKKNGKMEPRLAWINGRISLAHEDAHGYATALRQFLDF